MIHFLTTVYGHNDPKKAATLQALQSKFIEEYVPDSYTWIVAEGCEELVERPTVSLFHEDPPSPGADREAGTMDLGRKLDFLSAKIRGELDPNDILIFLDGDAWPVSETFVMRLQSMLSSFKVVYMRDRALKCPSHSFFAIATEDWFSTASTWEAMLVPSSHEDFKIAGKTYSEERRVAGGALSYLLQHPAVAYELTKSRSPFNPDYYCTYGDPLGPMLYHHGGGSLSDGIPEYEALKQNWLLKTGYCGAGWAKPEEEPKAAINTHQKLSKKILKDIQKNDMSKWGLPKIESKSKQS